jgi:hypothetical protein
MYPQQGTFEWIRKESLKVTRHANVKEDKEMFT